MYKRNFTVHYLEFYILIRTLILNILFKHISLVLTVLIFRILLGEAETVGEVGEVTVCRDK